MNKTDISIPAVFNMKNPTRFVIHRHTKAGKVHWDLMLEAGNILQTYRLSLPPEKLLQKRCTATKIFDHPLKFLTYEGAVEKATGSVQIADSGTYAAIKHQAECIELQSDGQILKGKFTLIHIEGKKFEFGPAQS